MVVINTSAEDDFVLIFWGLINWEKHRLEIDHVKMYLNDIRTACIQLDGKTYHSNNTLTGFKKYGKKMYMYKRNDKTQWFIIYNIDRFGNVFINRITSNYINKKEKYSDL